MRHAFRLVHVRRSRARLRRAAAVSRGLLAGGRMRGRSIKLMLLVGCAAVFAVVAVQAAAGAGATVVRGDQLLAGASNCPDADEFTYRMAGDLVGCWYTDSGEVRNETPSGVVTVSGTEHFVGCLNTNGIRRAIRVSRTARSTRPTPSRPSTRPQVTRSTVVVTTRSSRALTASWERAVSCRSPISRARVASPITGRSGCKSRQPGGHRDPLVPLNLGRGRRFQPGGLLMVPIGGV